LAVEVVGDADPQQCCRHRPAVGDFVEQRLVERVVDEEEPGELGEASAGVAGSVNQLGAQVGQDGDAVVGHDVSFLETVFDVPVGAGCAGTGRVAVSTPKRPADKQEADFRPGEPGAQRHGGELA
jgi:hypothetical protein